MSREFFAKWKKEYLRMAPLNHPLPMSTHGGLALCELLENPDIGEANDYQYLIKAIADVAKARGKGDIAEKSGISRMITMIYDNCEPTHTGLCN